MNSWKILGTCLIVLICSLLTFTLFDGLFTDGLTYASISRNLSVGVGSPMDLHYTETVKPHFHDAPPLFFWLESTFFTLFGDHFFTEKIFCLLLLLLAIYLIKKIWKALYPGEQNYSALLLMLLFTVNPRVMWAFSNNMVECLLTPLLLIFMLVLVRQEKIRPLFFYVLLCILFLSILLTKGPNGIFILAAFPILAILFKNIKKQLINVSVLLITSGVVIALVYFSSTDFKNYTDAFVQDQVIKSAMSLRESSGSHFTFLGILFNDLLMLIILFPLIFWFRKKRNTITYRQDGQNALLFLLTGICMPLMFLVSSKQNGYYFVIAYPFFYLSFFCFFRQEIGFISAKIQFFLFSLHRSVLMGSGILIAVGLLTLNIYFFGAFIRDKELVMDVAAIDAFFQEEKLIPADSGCMQHWALIGYLERKFDRSPRDVRDTDHFYISTQSGQGKLVKKLNALYIYSR